jgi:hypothetical protein
MKLLGLVPNFYIHVSVSDLYIPTISPPILLYCVRNWERGRAVFFLGIFVSNLRYSTFAVRTVQCDTLIGPYLLCRLCDQT